MTSFILPAILPAMYMDNVTIPFFTSVPEGMKQTSFPSLEFIVPNNYQVLSLQEKIYIIENLQELINNMWSSLRCGYYRCVNVTFSQGIVSLYVARFVEPAPLLRSSAVFQPDDLEHVLSQW